MMSHILRRLAGGSVSCSLDLFRSKCLQCRKQPAGGSQDEGSPNLTQNVQISGGSFKVVAGDANTTNLNTTNLNTTNVSNYNYNTYLDSDSTSNQHQPTKIVNRPWETWNLDKQFLRALSRHNTDQPDQTLNRVVANICDNLEVRASLLAFIPEGPFPARDLVKALGSLVGLAVVRSIVYSLFWTIPNP
jgi:hypothetical protein